MHPEIFNQKRMDRCVEIHRSIVDAAEKTKSFTVRATDSVEGIHLDELRTRYFAVGVGEDETEIPFTDLLVVLSINEQHVAALKKRKNKSETEFDLKFEITTEHSDEEAVRLLSSIELETPFDTGNSLRFSTIERPVDDPDDDQQT